MNLDEKTMTNVNKAENLNNAYLDTRDAIYKLDVDRHYKCATENDEWLIELVKAHALAALDTIWHNELVKITEDNSDGEEEK